MSRRARADVPPPVLRPGGLLFAVRSRVRQCPSSPAVRWPSVTNGRGERLRRTWPQRLVVVASLLVIVSAVVSARTVRYVEEVWEDVDRVQIVKSVQYGRELLHTETEPGDPVNFLLVGIDSGTDAAGGAAASQASGVAAGGKSLADVIMLLRLDPKAKSAWVLSIPRDLWAEIPGAQDHKINSAFFIGGAPLLVETVTSMFDVEINHYVQADFAGFQQLVDTLGGVPVWFPHPVHDPKSKLNITEPGCHVLGGEQALQYVRSRTYTELIDGRWTITGGDDFSRIARQQDFLVLALDRAISRGARNPTTIGGMIETGAAFVTIDQALTLGELVSVAQTFSDFNLEDLERQRLEVYTLWWPDGRYKGEAALHQANEPLLDVFRGAADAESAPGGPPPGVEAAPAPAAQRVVLAGGPVGESAGSFDGAAAGVAANSVAAQSAETDAGPATVLGRPPEGESCG